MIVEAVDTVRTLVWALAAWIAVLTVAGMVVALAGLAVGAWAMRGLWRTMSGALGPSRGYRGRCSALEGSDGGFPMHASQRPAGARLRPRPTWSKP